MKQTSKIWFLRHGETEWNRAYRLQGQLDSPLTPQGIKEAHKQAALMRPILAQAPDIWVSPLGRTQQTAAVALGGTPYRTDRRLIEIHAGDWQGLLRADIIEAHPQWAAQPPSPLQIYEAAPNGEGLQAFHARIVAFLAMLTNPTVIVAHGLLGQVMRAHLCGVPLDRAGHLSNLQGVIYLLENGTETVIGDPG